MDFFADNVYPIDREVPMKQQTLISLTLQETMFSPEMLDLLHTPMCRIRTQTYLSGVEALHISVGKAEVIWLPFLGGEIWEWKIENKSQKFSGFVFEPAYGKSFLHNYGAFLIHCGVLAMGNPTKEDNHPQHGEIPLSQPSRVWVEYESENTEYPLTLCCSFTFHVPFIASYTFTPKIHIHASGTTMIVDGELTNTAKTPLSYQYLAHINFAYPDSGTLDYSIDRFTSTEVEILQEAIDGVTKKPENMLKLDKDIVYDPELVAIIDHGRKAPSSYEDPRYVLSSMTRNDGTTRWVAADTQPLDHTVAWLTQTPDRAACGFSLPATSGPTGQVNETRKGNLKHLGPGETTNLWFAFGSSGPTFRDTVRTSIGNRNPKSKQSD